MLKSKQHLSVLEHGTVYLQSLGVFLDPEDTDVAYGNYLVSHYIHNPYSKVKIIHNEEWKANVYITTNYRVLVEIIGLVILDIYVNLQNIIKKNHS